MAERSDELEVDAATVADVETPSDRRFRLFSALWALAALAHLFNDEVQGLDEPVGWATVLAAIYLLFNPGSAKRLVAFSLIQVIEVIWIAPLVADHQLLMAVANVGVLVTVVPKLARNDWLREPGRFAASSFSSTARILVLIAYSGAALAKYNTTFLDPVTSCATFFADFGTNGLFQPSGWLGWAVVLLAIGSETLIALSLLSPRTRRFGVRYGIAFHFLLTASPWISVEDFSLTLDALFVFFLTDRDVDTLVASARRISGGSVIARWLRAIRHEVVRVGLVAGILFAVAVANPSFAARLVWPGGAAVGIWLMVNLVRSWNPNDRQPRLERPPLAHLGIVAVLALAVLSPYLGFRTLGVFTMFSNLRTAGEGTNHLFMPSLRLIDEQDDLVVPLEGSSEHYDQLRDDGMAMHYFELRRNFQGSDDVVFVGLRDGEPIDSRKSDFSIEPISVLESKLLFFRPAPDTGAPLCVN